MNLYKLVATLAIPPADADSATVTAWVGSQADAAGTRSNWISSGLVRKRADIVTEQVDVPTSKAELLAWLNTNVQ